PVDGEALEDVVAVVDVDDATRAVEHRPVAPGRVLAGLRAPDRDRRAGLAVALRRDRLAVLPRREVDHPARLDLVERGLDGAQRRGLRPVVGVVAGRADVDLLGPRLRVRGEVRDRTAPARED